MSKLLVFLSENAVDQAVTLKEIEARPFFKGLYLEDRRKKGQDPTAARVLLARLRKALDDYFTDLHYENRVRLALPKAVGGKYRLITCRNDSAYPQGKAVNRLWLPFLKPREAARILVSPLNRFADSQPKRVQSWRDRGPKDTYFPLGLFDFISEVSGFLRSRGVAWQIDYEERSARPDTSAIIIGDTLFADLQPQHIKLPTLLTEQAAAVWYNITERSQDSKARLTDAQSVGSKDFRDFIAHEDDAIEGGRWVPNGSFADHFRNQEGVRLFRCFASVTRLPLSWKHGIIAWRFSAHHSIAIEAALKFLLTPADAEKLWRRMVVPSKVHTGDDARDFHRPELASTLEELGLIFQVTCSFGDAASLDLRPGIPRHLLRIKGTKLLQVIQPQIPTASSLFYDPATTKDEVDDPMRTVKRKRTKL